MPPDFVTVSAPKEPHNIIHPSDDDPRVVTSEISPSSTNRTKPSSHVTEEGSTPLSSVISRVSHESNNSGYYGILDAYTGDCSTQLHEGNEVASSPTNNLQIADLATYKTTRSCSISSNLDPCQVVGNSTAWDKQAASVAQERYLNGPDSGRSSRTVVGSVGTLTDDESRRSDQTVSDVHNNGSLQSEIHYAVTVSHCSYRDKVNRIVKQRSQDKKRRQRYTQTLVKRLRASKVRIKFLSARKHAVKERAVAQENRLRAKLSQVSRDLEDTKNDLNHARSEFGSKDDTIGNLTSQHAILFEELEQTKKEKQRLENVNSYLQSDLERYGETEKTRTGDIESETSALKLRIKTLMQACKDGERHRTALIAENLRIWEAHEGDRDGKLNHDPEIKALKASLEDVKQDNLELLRHHEEYARSKDVELAKLRLDNTRIQHELDLGKAHIETLYDFALIKRTLNLPHEIHGTQQGTTLEQQMQDVFVETVNDNDWLIAAFKEAKVEAGTHLYLLTEEKKKVVSIEADLQVMTTEREELKASLSQVNDELLGCRIERDEVLPKEYERQTTKKRVEISNLKYKVNQLKIENAHFNPDTPPEERGAAVKRFRHSVSRLLDEIGQLRRERDDLKDLTQQQEHEIDEAREAVYTLQETHAIDMSRLQHEVTCLREITNGEISPNVQAIHYRLQHERRTREEAEDQLESMAQRYEALLQRIMGAGTIPTREPHIQDQDAGLHETSYGFDYADDGQSQSGEDPAEGSIAISTEQSQPVDSDSNDGVEEDLIEPNAPHDQPETSSERADTWSSDMPRLLDEDPGLPVLSDRPVADDVSSKGPTEAEHHPLRELLEGSTEDTNEPIEEEHSDGHEPNDDVPEPVRGNSLLQDLLQDSVPDEPQAQNVAPRELYINAQIRVQPQIAPWPPVWPNNVPAQQALGPTHHVPRSRFANIWNQPRAG